jgi:hypothetical protein
MEPDPGVLWLGTFDKGLIRADFNNGKTLKQPKIDRFGKEGIEWMDRYWSLRKEMVLYSVPQMGFLSGDQ